MIFLNIYCLKGIYGNTYMEFYEDLSLWLRTHMSLHFYLFIKEVKPELNFLEWYLKYIYLSLRKSNKYYKNSCKSNSTKFLYYICNFRVTDTHLLKKK